MSEQQNKPTGELFNNQNSQNSLFDKKDNDKQPSLFSDLNTNNLFGNLGNVAATTGQGLFANLGGQKDTGSFNNIANQSN